MGGSSELLRLFVVWAAAGAAHLVANQAVAAYGQRRLRAAPAAQSLPLADLGHALLPRVRLPPWGGALLELWAPAPGLLAVALGPPECAALFLRAHAAVLVLRPCCFLGTILPDASGVSDPRPRLLSLAGGIHDLMFSGHVAAALCGVLAWASTCGAGAPAALRAAAFAACAAQSLAILAARKHYTVDVVVAWIVCPLLCAALREAPA
jgi:hypothetical protein